MYTTSTIIAHTLITRLYVHPKTRIYLHKKGFRVPSRKNYAWGDMRNWKSVRFSGSIRAYSNKLFCECSCELENLFDFPGLFVPTRTNYSASVHAKLKICSIFRVYSSCLLELINCSARVNAKLKICSTYRVCSCLLNKIIAPVYIRKIENLFDFPGMLVPSPQNQPFSSRVRRTYYRTTVRKIEDQSRNASTTDNGLFLLCESVRLSLPIKMLWCACTSCH
jgi:hypothetical protein